MQRRISRNCAHLPQGCLLPLRATVAVEKSHTGHRSLNTEGRGQELRKQECGVWGSLGGRCGSVLVAWRRTADSEGVRAGDPMRNPGAADPGATADLRSPRGSSSTQLAFCSGAGHRAQGHSLLLRLLTEKQRPLLQTAQFLQGRAQAAGLASSCAAQDRHTAPAHTASPPWAPETHSGKSTPAITSCTSLAFDYTPNSFLILLCVLVLCTS